MTRGERMFETLKMALVEGEGGRDIADRLRFNADWQETLVTGPGANSPSDHALKLMHQAGVVAYQREGLIPFPCFDCWRAYDKWEHQTSDCEHNGGRLLLVSELREEVS